MRINPVLSTTIVMLYIHVVAFAKARRVNCIIFKLQMKKSIDEDVSRLSSASSLEDQKLKFVRLDMLDSSIQL